MDNSTEKTSWKVSKKQHFKCLVILPTIFSVISCFSGFCLLLICFIPAINYAKKVHTKLQIIDLHVQQSHATHTGQKLAYLIANR